MSEDSSANMRRFIQQQNAAIASDPDYPLNDFEHKMKVGNIPGPEERARTERELINAANNIAGGRSQMPNSVLNEAERASKEERTVALNKQRSIVNQLRQNQASQNPAYREELRKKAEQATRRKKEFVLPIEQEMINAGMKEFATLKDTTNQYDPGEYGISGQESSKPSSGCRLPQAPSDEDGDYEIVD